MRYEADRKQATRQRIIEAAGRRLKHDGIDGSGIATLMADAGLTVGAFYAHFASKDDLVATTVGDQLCRQTERFVAQASEPGGLEQLVRSYLSVQHMDNSDQGCPSAALLDEIGRCGDTTKQAYTDGVVSVVDAIGARIAPHDPSSARLTTLGVFAMMVGTLQLARALSDRELAESLLEQGVRNALALLDAGSDRPGAQPDC